MLAEEGILVQKNGNLLWVEALGHWMMTTDEEKFEVIVSGLEPPFYYHFEPADPLFMNKIKTLISGREQVLLS